MTAGQVAAWETFAGMAFTALVAAAVTVWQGRKTRHTNTREHGNTEQHLLDLHHKVDKVNGKVDRHGRRLNLLARKLDAHLNDDERTKK